VSDDAGEYLDQLRHLGMAEVGATNAIEIRALAFVMRFGVTFYDAVYHAVAAELDGTLVTADRRYLARVGGDPTVVDLHEISKA
jgi:predicted nucleic acid-binding protein